MAKRPVLAFKVAECIAEWANTETMLGLLLGFLLHAKARTALAMYMALENRAAQLRMLDSAAKVELDQRHYDVLTIVMERFVRPLMKTRDKLAHWCWGHSPDLPNDLLLMEPDEALLIHYRVLHGPGLLDPTEVNDAKIFVVTDEYLVRLLRDVRKAQSYIAQLIRTLDHQAPVLRPDSSALDRLSSVPEIQEGLARLEERRKKQQQAEPQSPAHNSFSDTRIKPAGAPAPSESLGNRHLPAPRAQETPYTARGEALAKAARAEDSWPAVSTASTDRLLYRRLCLVSPSRCH